jgi:hypothetical protein
MAYEHCAAAMVQTTIVCGFGVLVFGLSGFVPTASFATLMFVLLVTALVGDLLFLPAILAGPLGRFFESAPAAKASWLDALQLRWRRPAPALVEAAPEPGV